MTLKMFSGSPSLSVGTRAGGPAPTGAEAAIVPDGGGFGSTHSCLSLCLLFFKFRARWQPRARLSLSLYVRAPVDPTGILRLFQSKAGAIPALFSLFRGTLSIGGEEDKEEERGRGEGDGAKWQKGGGAKPVGGL